MNFSSVGRNYNKPNILTKIAKTIKSVKPQSIPVEKMVPPPSTLQKPLSPKHNKEIIQTATNGLYQEAVLKLKEEIDKPNSKIQSTTA